MDAMKWLIAALAFIALLVSGYAVYQTKRIEAATKPHVRFIAAVTR
jgi:membrane protease YdiL (CAAX protease family)